MVSVFDRMSKRASGAARLFAAGIAVVVVLVGAPARATAGAYHVYSCRTPSGESAPADGWSGSTSGVETVALDTCGQGGALVAALRAGSARTVGGSLAMWAFATPPDATISAGTLWRAGDAIGGAVADATYQFVLAAPSETQVFDACSYLSGCTKETGDIGQPFASVNRAPIPSTHLGAHLYLKASCSGVLEYSCPASPGDENGYATVAYLYAADLTLEQNAGPTASNVSGELASAATVTGTSDVAFSASDPGSGVYEALFSVDGRVLQSTVVDENGGRCRNVGQTTDGLAAFLYVQPCRASLSADVGFDTTRASNGVHHLVVSVIDAAGNAATVLDRNVTIYNPPGAGAPGAANGTNASARATLTASWKGSRRARVTRSYGDAETIVGRLTAAGGAPIAGALIDVRATPDYAGARTAAMASPRTAADGRFSIRIPRGVSSRALRLAYRSHLGETLPVATRTLTLSVRAGVALSVSPRTASVGSSIRFSGRLRGGPIPAGGKLLVLEARSPGGAWLEFDVVRSDARGRYHAGYRFKFPGPAQYQFRVLCQAEADYPFATGASEVVWVGER
jgi:hypothetical protein